MVLTTRSLFSAVFLIALVVLAARNATDPDLGWHLRTGEYIVTNASVPQADFFSFTATGEERITHEWLLEALLYLLFKSWGFAALIFFSALVGTAGMVLLYLRCDGKPYLASFVVLLAALALAPFWGTRPQTVTLLFANIFLYLLDRFKRGETGRAIFLLAPLTLLWANLHGGYMLGLAFVLAYTVGMTVEHWARRAVGPYTDERRLAAVLFLSTAAAAINPVGLQLYLYPLQTLNNGIMQTFIQEWQPPDFASVAVLPYALMLVLTLGALAFARGRVGFIDTLLLTTLTLASLRSARQISLWVLVAAPILSAALADLGARIIEFSRSRYQTGDQSHGRPGGRLMTSLAENDPLPVLKRETKPSGPIIVLNWLLLLTIALAACMRVETVIADQARAETEYFPVGAVEAIELKGLRGPILNQYEWGGYLIWRLYPQEQVFIDGRADLYALKSDRVVEDYLEAWSAGPSWRSTLDRYGIRLVLVSPSAPLSTKLDGNKDWREVYRDRLAVVFTRNQ